MRRELTLLERLAARAPRSTPVSAGPSAAEDIEERMESVRRNLVRLLNARHGMAETVSDYGLPALTDVLVGSADFVQRIQDGIRRTIEKYEPRLRRVRVIHQTDEGHAHKLMFRVEGVIVSRSGEQRVWYETALAPHGAMAVSG